MAVTAEQQSYQGYHEVVINLGLGRAPRNTSREDIVRALRNIDGVEVETTGSLRSHEGIWGVGRKSGRFTSTEIKKIKAAAQRIANKG